MIQPRSLPALSCHSLHLSYRRKEVLQSSMAELLAVPEFLGKLTHHTEGCLVNHPWANWKSKRWHLKLRHTISTWLRDTLSYLLHLFLIPTVISWNIKLRCAQLAVVLAVPEKLWNYGMWLQKFACWTGKLKRINYLQRNSQYIRLNAHAGIICATKSQAPVYPLLTNPSHVGWKPVGNMAASVGTIFESALEGSSWGEMKTHTYLPIFPVLPAINGWRKTSKNDPKRTCRTKQVKKTSSRQS